MVDRDVFDMEEEELEKMDSLVSEWAEEISSRLRAPID